jgi:hypothetical protein
MFSAGVEVAVSNCRAHGCQFVPQFRRVAFQYGRGGSPGDFFDRGAHFISFLNLIGVW